MIKMSKSLIKKSSISADEIGPLLAKCQKTSLMLANYIPKIKKRLEKTMKKDTKHEQ